MHSPAIHRGRSRGFSLVEVTMVVLILAIMAAMAQPRFANSLARNRATSAAQRIAADIAFAQRMGKLGSTGQTIVFTTNSSAPLYTMAGVADPWKGGTPYQVNLALDPYLVSYITTTFASNTITFDRYAQISVGGTITVVSGNCTKVITVDANTGQTTIQ